MGKEKKNIYVICNYMCMLDIIDDSPAHGHIECACDLSKDLVINIHVEVYL